MSRSASSQQANCAGFVRRWNKQKTAGKTAKENKYETKKTVYAGNGGAAGAGVHHGYGGVRVLRGQRQKDDYADGLQNP
jgi:hypothetical protein